MSDFLTLTSQLSTAVDQLNQVLQGDENATVMINGEEKPSVQKKTLDEVLARVQLVLDAAADIDAVKYANTAAGIANTTDGDYFSVFSNDPENYLDLYKNDNGTAIYQKSYPTTKAIKTKSENNLFSLKESIAHKNLFSAQQYNCEVLPDEIVNGNFELVVVDNKPMIRGYVTESSGAINLRARYTSVNINNFKSGKISASIYVHSSNTGLEATVSITQRGSGGSAVQTDEVTIHEIGGSILEPTEFTTVVDVHPDADREVEVYIQAPRQASAANNKEILFHSVCLADSNVSGFRNGEDKELPIVEEDSKNLFDYNSSLEEHRLNATFGIPEPFNYYVVSDFIEVAPQTVYSSNLNITRWAEYDHNKTLINGTKTNVETFTTHSRAKYVRLSLSTINGAYSQNLTRTDSGVPFTEFGIEEQPSVIEIKQIEQLSRSTRNIVNKDTLKRGSISEISGVPIYSESIFYTDEYISILPSEKYTSKYSVSVCYYNSNKEFISKLAINALETFTTPNDAEYARFTVNEVSIKEIFVCLGDEVGYANETNQNYKLLDLAIESGQLDFMTKTSQIINKEDLIYGFKLSSSGTSIEKNRDYVVSASKTIIPSGETYLKTFYPLSAIITFYDKSDEVISRHSTGNVNALAIPAEAASLRYSFVKSNVFRAMLNFGQESKQYQEYGYVIDYDKLARQQKFNADSVIKPLAIPSGYYKSNPSFNYARYDFDSSVYTINDLITEWNQLISDHSDYLSSEVMGKDSSGNYDIIKVTAKSEDRNLVGSTRYKLPKIVIACGLHGFEKHSMFDMLLLMKDICENWENDEVLSFLRWNVEIVFIPYCNPWGMAQGDTAELGRRNYNGVDCNRNFPNFWDEADDDPTSLYYRGTAPLSEAESQYVDAMFRDNADALIAIDHHNHSGTDLDKLTWVQFVIGEGYHPYVDVACQKTLLDTANSFRSSDYGMTGSGVAGYASQDYGSTCSSHGHFEYGIPSILVETFKTMDGLDRSKALQGCTEALGNLFTNLVRAKFS